MTSYWQGSTLRMESASVVGIHRPTVLTLTPLELFEKCFHLTSPDLKWLIFCPAWIVFDSCDRRSPHTSRKVKQV